MDTNLLHYGYYLHCLDQERGGDYLWTTNLDYVDEYTCYLDEFAKVRLEYAEIMDEMYWEE